MLQRLRAAVAAPALPQAHHQHGGAAVLHQAGFFHGGVAMRHLFDLARVERVAVAGHAVGAAAQHMQVARRIKVAHVAHHHPAVAQGFAGLFGVEPVALKPHRRHHGDQAHLARGQRHKLVVADHYVHPRHHAAHGGEDVVAPRVALRVHMLVRQQPGDGGQGLQAAIALLEDGPEAADGLGDLGRGHHLRAVGHVGQRGQVVLVQRGLVQQVDDGRGRQERARHAVLLDQPGQRGGAEVLGHHQRRARQQCGQHQA